MKCSWTGRVMLMLTPVALLATGAHMLLRDPPASAPATAVKTRPPNVIFISVDTLRADHLGCYGYDRPTSPNLDTLAQQGVRFANALSQASWTLPSHMSMMTSQYPHVHGVEEDKHALPEGATTLAEVLSANDYHTAAFVTWVYVSRKYGFAQGFDEYAELLPPEDKVDSTTSAAFKAEQVTERATRWLEDAPDRPFFLFLHYFDPHINYEAPPPYERMFDPSYEGPADGTFAWIKTYIKGLHREPNRIGMRELEHVTALYDGEIRYADAQLGRLFETIDRTVGMDNCLIVFTSDHGEELNEHGSMEGHQWTLYDEVVHVPLLIRPPGGRSGGRVVDTPVELIDIPATVLAMLGIPGPAEFQGRDRSGLFGQGPDVAEPSAAFGEIRRFNRKQYVRTDRYKLIHTDDIGTNKRGVPVVPGYELYDLHSDPLEQKNIFDPEWRVARRMMRMLEARKQSAPAAPPVVEASEVELTNHEIERLRSLGYVGSSDE